jgi:hypothetical protein
MKMCSLIVTLELGILWWAAAGAAVLSGIVVMAGAPANAAAQLVVRCQLLVNMPFYGLY